MKNRTFVTCLALIAALAASLPVLAAQRGPGGGSGEPKMEPDRECAFGDAAECLQVRQRLRDPLLCEDCSFGPMAGKGPQAGNGPKSGSGNGPKEGKGLGNGPKDGSGKGAGGGPKDGSGANCPKK